MMPSLNYFKQTVSRYTFSSKVNTSIEKLPDEILDNYRNIIKGGKMNDEIWKEFEVEIINNIHFLDADQFTDVVCLFGKADKGTFDLWELVSRKIFDYELDVVQSHELFEALDNTTKPEHFIYDPLFRNNLTKHLNRDDKKYDLHESLIY